MNDSAIDYSKVLTELIQKQMVLIGPDITFGIVKKVGGLHVDQNGVVMRIDNADTRSLLTSLLNEFFSLSELIAKKSVEILLENYPELPIDPKAYGVAKRVELPQALSDNTQGPQKTVQAPEKKIFTPKAEEPKPVPILEKPTISSQPQVITPKVIESTQIATPPVAPSRPMGVSAFTRPLQKEDKKEERKVAAPPTLQKEDVAKIVEAEKKTPQQPLISELTPLNSDEDEQAAAKKINELFSTKE